MAQFKVGLTGGIGSGKSSVAKRLAAHGIVIIDADQISRAATATGGAAIEAIREAFGVQMINAEDALDRAQMRQLVFSDPQARRRLEAIVHPIVQTQMAEQAAQASSPYVVYDIPLLIESIERYRPQFDRICVVDCDELTQLMRVQSRDNLSIEEVQRIISSQVSRATRLRHADDVIDNGKNTDLDGLQLQVDSKHALWVALSKKGSS